MTNLKTLKEIERDLFEKYKELGDEDNFTFHSEELKAEAIKWIKDLYKIEMERGNYIKGSKNNHHINPRNSGKIQFIKHFFNITEEDKDV